MIRLFDTATGQVTQLRTRTAGEVSMYVCGPTVYGPPHLGHGRFSLVFDVLRRYLIWSGQRVTYVSNITDIDDKIIAKAASEGRGSDAIAKEFEDVWYEAMDAIGVMRPDEDPHATAYVDDMVSMIEALVERDSAYVTPDGVYLGVETSRVMAFWRTSPSTICSWAVGSGRSSASRPNVTPRTSRCGSSPSPVSPRGPRHGVMADPAGTPNVWS